MRVCRIVCASPVECDGACQREGGTREKEGEERERKKGRKRESAPTGDATGEWECKLGNARRRVTDGVSPARAGSHRQRHDHVIARALTKPLRTRGGHPCKELVERLRPAVAGRGLRLLAEGHALRT